MFVFFFQAEDGIRDLVRSRGLGDVYKRQVLDGVLLGSVDDVLDHGARVEVLEVEDLLVASGAVSYTHLTLPTSDLV